MTENLDDLPLGKRLREPFTSFEHGFRPIEAPMTHPNKPVSQRAEEIAISIADEAWSDSGHFDDLSPDRQREWEAVKSSAEQGALRAFAMSSPDHADEFMSVSITRDGVVTSHNAYDADFDQMVGATQKIIEALQQRYANRLKCPFASGKELRKAAEEAVLTRPAETLEGEDASEVATYDELAATMLVHAEAGRGMRLGPKGLRTAALAMRLVREEDEGIKVHDKLGRVVSELADWKDVYPDAESALEGVTETVNELYGCLVDGVFAKGVDSIETLPASTPSQSDVIEKCGAMSAAQGELYHAASQFALRETTECALGIVATNATQERCDHCDDCAMPCFKVRRLRSAVNAVARLQNEGATVSQLASKEGQRHG